MFRAFLAFTFSVICWAQAQAYTLTSEGVATTNNGSTLSVGPFTPPSGSLVYIVINDEVISSGDAPTDGTHEYNLAQTTSDAGLLGTFYWYYATSPGAITITHAPAATVASMSVTVIAGTNGTWDSSASKENDNIGQSASANATVTSGTAAETGELAIGSAAWYNVSTTMTQTSGFSTPPNAEASNAPLFSGNMTNSGGSAVTYGGTGSLSESDTWAVIVDLFEPSAAPVTVGLCTLSLMHAGPSCSPGGVAASYFGMTINGPVQSPFTWPVWYPSTFRILDQYDTTTGSNLPCWSCIETSLNTYVWTTFDAVASAYVSNGTKDVIWGYQNTPQWAEIGNAYSNTVTFAASVVTFTGTAPSTLGNGKFVFFNGGTLPAALTAGTDYWVINYNGTAKTYQLSTTYGGSAITFTTGSGTTTATMDNTTPSSQTYLTNFINSVLTRAATDGLNIAYFEGANEANAVPATPGSIGWQGSVADLVTLQETIYNAVQTWNSNNGTSIKVLSWPAADAGSYYNSTELGWQFLAAGGAAYFDILAYHGYPDALNSGSSTDPENINYDIALIQAAMIANGVSLKPIYITEYSSGGSQTAATNETYAAVTSLIATTLGVGRQYWYAYDNGSGYGQMWTEAGGLNAAGVAWQQLTKWMIGAKPTQTTFGVSLSTNTIPSSTGGPNLTFSTTQAMGLSPGTELYIAESKQSTAFIANVVSDVGTTLVVSYVNTNYGSGGTFSSWGIQLYASNIATVNFSRPGGYQAQAVWTQDGSTPSYTYPAGMTQYHNLAGTVTSLSGGTVTLGRNPILLENFSVF